MIKHTSNRADILGEKGGRSDTAGSINIAKGMRDCFKKRFQSCFTPLAAEHSPVPNHIVISLFPSDGHLLYKEVLPMIGMRGSSRSARMIVR